MTKYIRADTSMTSVLGRPMLSFISLELNNANPRLLIDFGSGTLELKIQTKNGLDDGDWHRIDIFWDREEVRMVVDFCSSAKVVELEDGTATEFDDKACQVSGKVPPFNEFLNVIKMWN